MTAKEKNTELEEMFSHKYALEEKVNWNRALLFKVEKAMEKGGSIENPISELIKKSLMGEKLLSIQTTELNKLTAQKIADQLGLSINAVNYGYRRHIKAQTEKVAA